MKERIFQPKGQLIEFGIIVLVFSLNGWTIKNLSNISKSTLNK